MPDDSSVNTSDETENLIPARRKSGEGAAEKRSVIPLAALVVGVLALALSGWALLRPTPEPAAPVETPDAAAGPFDDAQRKAANEKACAAYGVVREGVAVSTNARAPGGSRDASGAIAVGANARLALLGGGQYLLARIDPATAEKLAADATNFSNLLMDIGATSISGVPTADKEQGTRMKAAQNFSMSLADQCKLR